MWNGALQPSPYSTTYDVKIEYRLGYHPKTWILRPQLEPNSTGWLPHFFHDTETLCLYKDGEWAPCMLLARTIVPWAAEWLFHYEIWKFTGLWYGPGDDMAWAQNPGLQPIRAA